MEEQVRVGSCTVSLNKHGEICQIAKLGGTPVDAVVLLQCTSVALTKVKEFSELLDKQLAEDLKRRDKGGFMAELRAENDR
jgi:exosome complex component RRP45